METVPLHRAELQSSTPQRLYSEKTEVDKRTGQHVFEDPAAGQGHSDRSSYIKLTFSKPPGSYHHAHFTDEKTEPPTQALLWVCIVFPHLTICLVGLEPGFQSFHSAPTVQPP